jgi:hypothetical protein
MSQTAPVQKSVTTQSLHQSAPPDSVLYHALFMRYYAQEQFAAHIDAAGKKGLDGKPLTGAAVRSQLMKEIGLTAAEDATVKSAALNYVPGFYSFTQQRGQLLLAAKSVAAAAVTPPVGVTFPVATGTAPLGVVTGATGIILTGTTAGTTTSQNLSAIGTQIATLEQQHQ